MQALAEREAQQANRFIALSQHRRNASLPEFGFADQVRTFDCCQLGTELARAIGVSYSCGDDAECPDVFDVVGIGLESSFDFGTGFIPPACRHQRVLQIAAQRVALLRR